MNSKELLNLIPRPWKSFYISAILAIAVIFIAIFMESIIDKPFIKHFSVVVFFSFIFVSLTNGERKQFIALNSMRKDEILSDVKTATNVLFLKTIITSTIVILHFTIGTGISANIRILLMVISLLITWHNIYKGIAGDFRYRYVKMILSKAIEEKEKNA